MPSNPSGPTLDDNRRCLVCTAAAALLSERTLDAVLLDLGKHCVAVSAADPEAAHRSGARLAAAVGAAEAARLREGCGCEPAARACAECTRTEAEVRRQGLFLRRSRGGVELSRAENLPERAAWTWHDYSAAAPKACDEPVPEAEEDLDEWKMQAVAAALCGALGLLAHFLPGGAWTVPLFVGAFVSGGWYAAGETWERLRDRRLDVHFLMLTVAVGSAAIGAWSEGAMLLFLFSTSGALEHYAMGRTQREIRSLFHSAPKVATVLAADGSEREEKVETLRVGQRLLVKPGAQFPVDGEVARGKTACDESNLTGEATPVEKGVGDSVLAGTINLWGAVEVVVLRPVQESALEKIIHLIKEAQHLKAPSQRFTDKFGTRYTYGILALSVAMFFVWWLGAGLPAFVSSDTARSAFYRTMTLLVVASPCALVLSIPSAVLAAIAWGAKRGILFRGGAAVEKLAEVGVVALDKTGTLTTGELEVEAVESFPPGRAAEVARLAFSIERLSTHPLARAITRHGKQQGLEPVEFDHHESVTGLGIRADLGARRLNLGRREWLTAELGADPRWAELAQSTTVAGLSEVWIGDGDLLGRVLLRDDIRPQAAPVLARLKAIGVHVVVLTGDRPAAAQALQRQLGLADVRSELKPEQKVAAIREFMAQGKRVAMVGDGVNDAPSLAVAHVGVAMGARGADAALEQAEIVLMHDRLENFLAAFRLSQNARRVIRQNLFVSLGTVAVLVGFATLGQIPLTLGVLCHEGSTVIVVLNSLRLLFMRSDVPSVPGVAGAPDSSQPQTEPS